MKFLFKVLARLPLEEVMAEKEEEATMLTKVQGETHPRHLIPCTEALRSRRHSVPAVLLIMEFQVHQGVSGEVCLKYLLHLFQ